MGVTRAIIFIAINLITILKEDSFVLIMMMITIILLCMESYIDCNYIYSYDIFLNIRYNISSQPQGYHHLSLLTATVECIFIMRMMAMMIIIMVTDDDNDRVVMMMNMMRMMMMMAMMISMNTAF